MAFALNNAIAGMTSAQFNALSPQQKLSFSSSLPNEFLFHNSPRSAASLRTLPYFQQAHPQMIRTMIRRRPQVARRPKLPKRPLNSWMAFRSFYSALFSDLQQKEASSYLTILWQKDLCKAKWQILARAYSTIRDAIGRENAPLDVYLAIATSEIGILEVNDYLAMMNWVCEITADGATLLQQIAVPDLAAFPSHLQHAAMTEKDIIHILAKKNYISTALATRIAGAEAGLGLLATVPAPSAADRVALAVVRTSTPVIARTNNLEVFDIPGAIQTTSNVDVPIDYQWTGSMADLYNPAEGSLDLAHFMLPSFADAWEMTDIANPGFMENFIGRRHDGVYDGFLSPFVPEDETETFLT